MPLDTRFLHWLQAADDELLYTVGELSADAGGFAPPEPGIVEMRGMAEARWDAEEAGDG